MMNKKLTKRDIDLFSYAGGWDVRWDSSITGFGVRIYPSGKKSYVLSYRNEKNQKRLLTIGQTNKITLDQARDIAHIELAKVATKIDPIEEKRKTSSSRTVEKVFEEFLEKYAKEHNKTWQETNRIFKRDILPILGKKLIHDVTKQDIIKLLDATVKRGSKTMANRILANVRKFFNWCIERDLIETSPASKITKPAAEHSRDRVLSNEELQELWDVCNMDGYPYGHMVKFLILTAQRKDEAANLQWKDIDVRNKLWILPKEKTKSKRRHEIPLSDTALKILEEANSLCPNNADYVFTTLGDRPFSGFSKAKTRIDKKLAEVRKKNGNAEEFPEWRIHDLRRTAASGMASLGISPHIIEKVLNHSSGIISGVAAVYNRYDYLLEIKNALKIWSTHITP
jgi:integrase